MGISTKTRIAFAAVAAIARPAMNLLMKRQWHSLESLPRGGAIVVSNHVSELDPVAVAHAIYNSGSTPHFLAKDSLFRVPILKQALNAMEHIPVARENRSRAQGSLDVALSVLERGGVIIIYPEGTLTRDPDLWPMRCRTGAARLALKTGFPLIPITHWGVQDVLPRKAKFPSVFPRRRYHLQVGDPIDLSDLRGSALTRRVLAAATQRVEEALTEGVARLRGEDPPEHIWDRGARQRVLRNQLLDVDAQAEIEKPGESDER